MSMDDVAILRGADFLALAEVFTEAEIKGAPIRVCVDDGALKLKVGNGVWSPPLGERDPECMAAAARFVIACDARGVGGLVCDLPMDHQGRHRDPMRGEWRYPPEPVAQSVDLRDDAGHRVPCGRIECQVGDGN